MFGSMFANFKHFSELKFGSTYQKGCIQIAITKNDSVMYCGLHVML